jgi:arylsulfatase
MKAYHPRGVIRSVAAGKIEDTGPLNRKRMETIDDETTTAAIDFMKRQVQANKPFFTWMNATRMHATHVRESMRGQSGMVGNEYADGMVEHDGDVGKLLKTLDDLGIADNTIVVYTPITAPTNGRGPMPQRRRSAARRPRPSCRPSPSIRRASETTSMATTSSTT